MEEQPDQTQKELKDINTMSLDERVNFVKQIDALAEETGLDIDLVLYRETVAKLIGKPDVSDGITLKVGKECPSTDAEKVKLFNEKVKPLTEGVKGVEINVSSKMGAGDMYVTIEDLIPCFDGDEKTSIQHKEGEVILIDFWATWCGPCQKPMAHNQEMLEKKAAEWGDKVRIIGISSDPKDKLVPHIEKNGWTSVEHYHITAESQCKKVYGVRGIPHVLILDTKGRIVFKGHPATRKDLEADFDTLLKGEPLTGEGAWNGSSDDKKEDEGEPKAKEGYKFDYDPVAVDAQINDFKTLAEGWCADEEMKEKFKGFMRLFCVMTHNECYNRKLKKFESQFYNHRVLAGSQEKVDELKALFEEKVKGDFEIQFQEQVIKPDNTKKLATKAEFDEVLKSDKLVVVDFTASWCPPCRMIAPKFADLAVELKDEALLVKVDVDENNETSEHCGIQAMPTFQFYKNGEKVHEIKGADFEGLKAKINELK